VPAKTLIVLVGPTGVGKTDVSLEIAEALNCPIISSDSRQMYREMKIGTALPDETQLSKVKHYFIATKSIHDSYNAGQYELDVLDLLDELFKEQDVVMLVGGSMMYIDAVCEGLDDIPTVSEEVRQQVVDLCEKEGLGAVRELLQKLDPVQYERVDLNNKQRVMHAVEVCLMLNRPYSEILTSSSKHRNFDILKIGVNLPREELYARINLRVDKMMQEGLLSEVRSLYPYKKLNALNTVGYKEIFNYLDGIWSYDYAVQMIKQNSRRYAKRQLTWFNRDTKITWFQPGQLNEMLAFLEEKLRITETGTN
jgi:tRNA dimethylallyltransferase